ncbi:MAG TPA: hypothetical protein VIH90_08680 [Candidatus Saccharimonadales bacterium]
MKVVVLYRPSSDHGRIVDEFIENFRSRVSDQRIEVLNIDTREGNGTATLYDIVQYPAVLVLRSDGAIQKSWQGLELPLIDEVQSYARS